MMKFFKTTLMILLPIVILAAGFLGARMLILNRPAPQKEIQTNPGALVRVIEVEKQARRIEIVATGTVGTAREITVTPQVSGRIVEMAPGLVAGGFFRQGEPLFVIEAADYQLARERARAAIDKAESDIALLESRARVARLEWDRLHPKGEEEPNPLVVFEPQLKEAHANLAAARASLQQAELDLARTRISAPFNSLVRAEQVELGQYVRAGNSVAVLTGSDAAEIVVPVELDDLRWLTIPGPEAGDRYGTGKGSTVTIRVEMGGREHTWQGYIARMLGEVDTRGRMARLVVRVEDPFGLGHAADDDRPALALGMFVQVLLHGTILDDIVALPREVLRDDGGVWVVDREAKLRYRPVEIVRLEREQVLIDSGLESGDSVILSALPGGAEGMTLRAASPEPAKVLAERPAERPVKDTGGEAVDGDR